jgi:hypothetical protein
MGTPCITRIYDDEGEQICCLYRNYDGYLSEHGRELAEFLSGFTVGNRLGATKDRKVAKTMNCLAAQIVAHFKSEPGNFYMYPPTDDTEDYTYDVKLTGDSDLCIEYLRYGDKKFKGTPEEFAQYVKVPEQEEDDE